MSSRPEEVVNRKLGDIERTISTPWCSIRYKFVNNKVEVVIALRTVSNSQGRKYMNVCGNRPKYKEFLLYYTMATKYELPEEADDKLLSNLGEEVEMKTFKTNVLPKLECDKDQVVKIKILCLGDYAGGVGRKGVFINDYLQVTPPVVSFAAVIRVVTRHATLLGRSVA